MSIPPGTSQTLDYPIDSRVREATIRVTWDADGRAPSVKLIPPHGKPPIDPHKLPAGMSIASSPGEVTYSLLLPPLPSGPWKIQISNPHGGPATLAGGPRLAHTGLGGRMAMPLLTLGTQPAAGNLEVVVETSANSLLNMALAVTPTPGLALTVADAGLPVTGNTFVVATLTDPQAITHTLVLADDGASGDGAAEDGRYAVALDPVWGGGLYHASVIMRHFDRERGYIERTLESDIFIGMPELAFENMYWNDAPRHDGAIDPGDTISLQVELYNQGDGSAMAPQGTLIALDENVHVGSATSCYPVIGANAFGRNTNAYTFTIDPATPNGSTLTFEHRVTFGDTHTITMPITL